jgi:hypothetical protein
MFMVRNDASICHLQGWISGFLDHPLLDLPLRTPPCHGSMLCDPGPTRVCCRDYTVTATAASGGSRHDYPWRGLVAGGLVRPLVASSAVGGAMRWGRRGPKAVGRVLSLRVAVERSSASPPRLQRRPAHVMAAAARGYDCSRRRSCERNRPFTWLSSRWRIALRCRWLPSWGACIRVQQ